MLHADAKHPSCAYQWMNWSLEPKVQGDVAALVRIGAGFTGGLQGQRAAGEKGCETNGFNQFDKIAFWKTPQAGASCRSRWTRDYIAIMGGR